MEDKSIFDKSQPQDISENLRNFIEALVEEVVKEEKPFDDTKKKWLRKYSENEGLDYEKLEKNLTDFFETVDELKATGSKSAKKLARLQAKECYVSDEILEQFTEISTKQQTNGKQGGLDQTDDNLSNCTFTVNGVSFEMIAVEGGTFTMGATAEQGSDADSAEKPMHSVTLSSYYIGKCEVTQKLWRAVMCNNPSRFQGDDFPVERVSWNDCQTFISKLNQLCASQLNGRRFALPTEAQWEYAARGGKKSKGYKYSGSNDIHDVAWYGDNSGGTPHAVGTKTPNEIALCDMSGSVWEWCEDWYNSYGISNPACPSTGSSRVLRGGSWNSSAENCRVSGRNDYYPNGTSHVLGLRLSLR